MQESNSNKSAVITATEVSRKLRDHLNTITPGKPFTITDAHTVGDRVWQGDLGLQIVDRVPAGYEEIKNPTDADRKLVPGGNQGSHHNLKSLDGVRIFKPKNWGVSPNDLNGPCLIFDDSRGKHAIVHEPGTAHPHGTVFIDTGVSTTILCTYQRNLAADELVERRAQD